MSVCDALMWRYFELLSEKSNDEIRVLKEGHPMEAKFELAKEIVTRFHDAETAEHHLQRFKSTFDPKNKHQIPDDAPTITLHSDDGKMGIVHALVEGNLCKSNGEARRLISGGGLSVNGTRISEATFELGRGTHAVRAGKKRFANLIVE